MASSSSTAPATNAEGSPSGGRRQFLSNLFRRLVNTGETQPKEAQAAHSCQPGSHESLRHSRRNSAPAGQHYQDFSAGIFPDGLAEETTRMPSHGARPTEEESYCSHSSSQVEEDLDFDGNADVIVRIEIPLLKNCTRLNFKIDKGQSMISVLDMARSLVSDLTAKCALKSIGVNSADEALLKLNQRAEKQLDHWKRRLETADENARTRVWAVEHMMATARQAFSRNLQSLKGQLLRMEHLGRRENEQAVAPHDIMDFDPADFNMDEVRAKLRDKVELIIHEVEGNLMENFKSEIQSLQSRIDQFHASVVEDENLDISSGGFREHGADHLGACPNETAVEDEPTRVEQCSTPQQQNVTQANKLHNRNLAAGASRLLMKRGKYESCADKGDTGHAALGQAAPRRNAAPPLPTSREGGGQSSRGTVCDDLRESLGLSRAATSSFGRRKLCNESEDVGPVASEGVLHETPAKTEVVQPCIGQRSQTEPEITRGKHETKAGRTEVGSDLTQEATQEHQPSLRAPGNTLAVVGLCSGLQGEPSAKSARPETPSARQRSKTNRKEDRHADGDSEAPERHGAGTAASSSASASLGDILSKHGVATEPPGYRIGTLEPLSQPKRSAGRRPPLKKRAPSAVVASVAHEASRRSVTPQQQDAHEQPPSSEAEMSARVLVTDDAQSADEDMSLSLRPESRQSVGASSSHYPNGDALGLVLGSHGLDVDRPRSRIGALDASPHTKKSAKKKPCQPAAKKRVCNLTTYVAPHPDEPLLRVLSATPQPDNGQMVGWGSPLSETDAFAEATPRASCEQSPTSRRESPQLASSRLMPTPEPQPVDARNLSNSSCGWRSRGADTDSSFDDALDLGFDPFSSSSTRVPSLDAPAARKASVFGQPRRPSLDAPAARKASVFGQRKLVSDEPGPPLPSTSESEGQPNKKRFNSS